MRGVSLSTTCTLVGIDYAIEVPNTTGVLQAGFDVSDTRFFSPLAFSASPSVLEKIHIERFYPDREWLIEIAWEALDTRASSPTT